MLTFPSEDERADQELLLMSVGSLAHRARRHRSIAVPSRDGRHER